MAAPKVTEKRGNLYGFGESGDRLEAPATRRNRVHILEVLKNTLPKEGIILEIASGSGEHALYFASELLTLTWQPSDPEPQMIKSIAAWQQTEALDNLMAPLTINVLTPGWAKDVLTRSPGINAMVCINMIHIAPIEAAHGLFEGAGQLLPKDAPLVLYGPYKIDGQHTAPSNEAFDQRLRTENPSWGVRDLGDISNIAAGHGLQFKEKIDMPANNFSVIFRKN